MQVTQLCLVSLLVPDYDVAIVFFTKCLDFELLIDRPLDSHKRWVVVRPSLGGTGLLLAKAANGEQEQCVGRQAGGRVFLFLETNDFYRDYERFKDRGVDFAESPRVESYGVVAVFHDVFGNRWDLIEHFKA
jgi:catechol 2,3-dioxygenase-like lactoylglutathione lyase family enzyme